MGFTIKDNIIESYEGRDYELSLPENITEVGSWAFRGKKLLKSIQIRSGVVKFGSSAFSGCESLVTIDIPESVTYIGEHCFSDCTSLEQIIIPEGVTRIEESTFYGCTSLNEVFLPSTIEYIGKTAFNNCKNLVTIHFKTVPAKIEEDAFNGCDRLYEDTGMVIVGETIFGYSGKDGVLKIPSTVTSIAPGAFWHNKNLVEVEIPGSVEVIPARAFMDCSNLKKVILNEGLREICWLAFNYCRSIEEIIIPESVTAIGNSVFQNCENLKRIKLPSSIDTISSSMFSWCKSLENIVLPKSAKNIMRDAFAGTAIKDIDLSNVAFIDMDAFSMSKIERIVLGDNFHTPCSHMLNRCYALRYLYITDSVTEVEGWGPEFADQTTIPFIHVSSKLIKGLEDENKLNAVDTFIHTQDDYSEESRKNWLTYIKRYKVNLLKLCVDGRRCELYRKILDIVSLSEANVAEIKEYIEENVCENTERFYVDKLVAVDSVSQKTIKKASGTVIGQLIDMIPKSTSAVKKVYLLEAATLFGSHEEFQAVIDKYQSFEFTKGAVLIAFQTKQLNKMAALLKLNKYFCNGDYSSLKGKYGYFVDADFAHVITKEYNDTIYNHDVILNFIQNTLSVQKIQIEFAYGTDTKTKMLQEIIEHPNATTHSSLLHRAIMNRNFSIVLDLLEIGCAIDFFRIPQDTGYNLSRMIPSLEVEQALVVLKQYTAPVGIEKIKLDDSEIYVGGTSFSNPDVFAAVCSGYNIERFAKKKLLEFAVSLPDTKNLQYLLENGYVKATKPLILSSIEAAKNSKNFVVEQWLVKYFEDKYGEAGIAAEKAHSLTPLERIKKDWSYTVVDGEVYIKSYKGNSSAVVVPSVISGKTVTKIDYDAFSPEAPRINAEVKNHRNEIEEITLPSGFVGFYSDLWRHDRKQFGNNFKRFVIPEDSCEYSYDLLGKLLDIADVENVKNAGGFVESEGVVYAEDYSVVVGARKNNNIRKYVMPASVKFVVKGFWNGLTDLEDLTITSQIKVYDGETSYSRLEYEFGNMKKLKRVTVSGMTVFPGHLLSYAETIEEVFIDEGIQKIEKFAFDTCKSLRKLTIPRSCTEIGDHIFPRVYEKDWYGRSKYVGLPEGFMLYCYEGSYAEQYAKEENAPFTYLRGDRAN